MLGLSKELCLVATILKAGAILPICTLVINLYTITFWETEFYLLSVQSKTEFCPERLVLGSRRKSFVTKKKYKKITTVLDSIQCRCRKISWLIKATLISSAAGSIFLFFFTMMHIACFPYQNENFSFTKWITIGIFLQWWIQRFY